MFSFRAYMCGRTEECIVIEHPMLWGDLERSYDIIGRVVQWTFGSQARTHHKHILCKPQLCKTYFVQAPVGDSECMQK